MSRRAFASLRFLGEDLEPETLSDVLGILPTTAYRKGDHYEAGRLKKMQVRKFGLWLFDTETVEKSENLSAHIEIIQHLMTDNVCRFWSDARYSLVHGFVRDNKIKMDVGLFWRGDANDDPPYVPNEFEECIRSMSGIVERDFPPHRDAHGYQSQVFA